MKKWTVLVMPHDQGNTRTIHIYSLQVWAVVAVLSALAFTSAFTYARYRSARFDAEAFRKQTLDLQIAVSRKAPEVGLGEAEKSALEAKIRAEYNAKDDKIKSELSALYDLEAEVRSIHGLPPKDAAVRVASGPIGGGKGGGSGESESEDALAQYPEQVEGDFLTPPSVIYGIANPPADMIVQEISLRTASLHQLIAAMDSKKSLVERTPSIWPTKHPRAYISSGFGYRVDPFSRNIQLHDGVDFPAPMGSDVIATARGTVTEAYYDRWLGNLVKIDHGSGIETWYGHMSALDAKAGDEVSRGDVIGKVGSTGRSTGCHIHYEVHTNGKRINPIRYLGQ